MVQYTRNGLVYPEGGNLVRDGANVMAQLAGSLDPEPKALAVTPAAGWALNAGLVTQVGPFVYWTMDMTRTGAIATDPTGNILTDVAVFTGLPDPYKPYRMVNMAPQATKAPVTCVKSENHNLFGYVNEAGACWLTHGFPGQNYAQGSGYRFTAFYLLNF